MAKVVYSYQLRMCTFVQLPEDTVQVYSYQLYFTGCTLYTSYQWRLDRCPVTIVTSDQTPASLHERGKQELMEMKDDCSR